MGTINQMSYPLDCADLCIFTVYAVRNRKKLESIDIDLHWEADTVPKTTNQLLGNP